MENKHFARVLEEMADILEILDDNPFRIRSLRRGAQVIENLSFSVAQALEEDAEKVRAVAGIGDRILAKLQELVETGECREHEELREKIPVDLLTLLEIPNLGPKKINLFWRTLNVTNLDGLEAAAREGRLRRLPGMGEKSEAKLLKALEEFRKRQGRYRLDDGMELSRAVIDYLRSKLPIRRISEAGSVRRRRETIGDLDVLVSCDDPAAVMEAFVRHPDVLEVLARGGTKASAILRPGIQTDLRVLEDDSFGAALQYFTGSKEHNVALRERAKRVGYKINEYGLFRLKEGGEEEEAKVAGRDEAEIYEHLGLPYIEPELRENRGEIESAEKGTLPELIELADVRGDLHMHTRASDGANTVEEMIEAALRFGHEYIAITDHSKALAMTRGLDEERLVEHIQEIDRIGKRFPQIEVLKGIEVDILADGALDLSDEALARLDVVIASIHSRFNLTEKEMTLRVCRALENPNVNILGHPTGRLLTRRDPYPLDVEKVIRAAVAHRVCLEINAYPARLDLNDVYSRTARDMGALISINSDSHNTEMLRYMRYGIYTARRGWLEANDVINTFSLSRLRRVLAKEEYR